MSTSSIHKDALPPGLVLELRVVETSPNHLGISITAPTVMEMNFETEGGHKRVKKFKVAYSRGKSFFGVVAGSEETRSILTFNEDNLHGVTALVDGGYNNEEQTSPERKMELITVEKYPLVIGSWVLPREKHERPLRIDIITGALKALLAE